MANKNILILSLSFLFIFFGYDGVEQFLTPFFSDFGNVGVGFNILILIYASFTISNFFIVGIIHKIGLKGSMILGSVFYSLFIFSVLAGSVFFIYLFSIFLGCAAAFLWTGSTSYLLRISDEKNYGKNSGFFNAARNFGGLLGVLIFASLLKFFSYSLLILMLAFFPLLGFLLLFLLADTKTIEPKNQIKLIKKTFTNIPALKLSFIFFSFSFVYGLSQGIFPLQIKEIFGVAFIGMLVIFRAFPIILSYFFGKVSDERGRSPIINFSFLVSVISFILLYLYPHNPIFFITGIFLLAVTNSAVYTLRVAMIGDISEKNNIEILASLFFVMSNLGMIASFAVSAIFIEARPVYLTSIFVMIISYLVALPALSKPVQEIKREVSNHYA